MRQRAKFPCQTGQCLTIFPTMTVPAITYRALEPADWAEITAVWKSTDIGHKPKGRDSEERIIREMSMSQNRFLGAFEGPRMVGVVIANYDGRRGWINRLAVHPEFRGRGIAGALLERAESFLTDRGALVISALIESNNAASIRAFSKGGYSCLDTIKYFSKRPNWDV